MSWIITGKEADPLLLDSYSGAAAAYSLRQLSWAYGGPVVRVRRDNDNAEQDFTATEVSDGTLAAWVGAGNDGFVRTWYDQSGNGYDFVQTILSNQPTLVSSGALVLISGKPGIQTVLDDTPNAIGLTVDSFPVSQPFTVFAAANRATTDNRQILLATDDVVTRLALNGITSAIQSGAGADVVYATITTGKQLHYGFYSGANSEFAQNGAIATTGNAGTNSFADLKFSKTSGGSNVYGWIGQIFEAIIYPSDQSTNRAAIEANINAHYNIF